MQLFTIPSRMVLLGWLMVLSSVGHAQIILDRPKATPAPAKPRVVEKRVYVPTPRPTTSPVPAAAYASLLLSTDLRVRINVNNGPAITLVPEDLIKVGLEKGSNLIRVTPVDGGTDGYIFPITVDQPGPQRPFFNNDIYGIRLGFIRQQAQAERLAKAEAERLAKAQAERQAQLEQERQKRLPKVLEEIARQMVSVAGGTFMMGSREQGERPLHNVTLSSFSISKYEVTQLQWETIMGKNPSHYKDCPTCPVENVSWYDVQAFLTRLNQLSGKQYRLPTEAQWEYAARGGAQGRGTIFAGSESLDAVAWYKDSFGKPHPVGQKQPNELGLYDMSGNVTEWCQDWWSDNYYRKSPDVDPLGPDSGESRIVRGGNFGNLPEYCRVTSRSTRHPENPYSYCGFRVVTQAQ